MLFEQFIDPESSTYTYLIGDEADGEAVIIDPVAEHIRRDYLALKARNLTLRYIVETHVHADHVTSAAGLRALTGAEVAAADSRVKGVDRLLDDGDQLHFGSYTLRVLATPGHTSTCISLVLDGARCVFTGDTLLIQGTGRADFQGGSAKRLYQSITEKLFALPGDYKVYPGHDYKGRRFSTIEAERTSNPRVAGKSVVDFENIMDRLQLALPKKIAVAVPANLNLGLDSVHLEDLEVTCSWLKDHRETVRLVDIRGAEEQAAGMIPGAQPGSVDQVLADGWPLDQPIIMQCRSGRRSLDATQSLRYLGYDQVRSLAGGILAWQEMETAETVADNS